MENETIPEISVGAALICKNDKPLKGNTIAPPVKLDETYEAKQVITCSCGKKHIDVGLVSEFNWVSCNDCKEVLPESDKIHWCHPSRFELK